MDVKTIKITTVIAVNDNLFLDGHNRASIVFR
jgi:hypothetical protein